MGRKRKAKQDGRTAKPKPKLQVFKVKYTKPPKGVPSYKAPQVRAYHKRRQILLEEWIGKQLGGTWNADRLMRPTERLRTGSGLSVRSKVPVNPHATEDLFIKYLDRIGNPLQITRGHVKDWLEFMTPEEVSNILGVRRAFVDRVAKEITGYEEKADS